MASSRSGLMAGWNLPVSGVLLCFVILCCLGAGCTFLPGFSGQQPNDGGSLPGGVPEWTVATSWNTNQDRALSCDQLLSCYPLPPPPYIIPEHEQSRCIENINNDIYGVPYGWTSTEQGYVVPKLDPPLHVVTISIIDHGRGYIQTEINEGDPKNWCLATGAPVGGLATPKEFQYKGYPGCEYQIGPDSNAFIIKHVLINNRVEVIVSGMNTKDTGYTTGRDDIENFLNMIDLDAIANGRCKVLSELKANPGGPYTVERGQPLMLDGSRSKGSIVQYKWKFEPGSGCPSGTSLTSAEMEGQNPQVTLLCPVKATLTVSDGQKQDSASVTIPVTARTWKTPFIQSPEGIYQNREAVKPPWYPDTNLRVTGQTAMGANICGACEGNGNNGCSNLPTENFDFLHPPPKDGNGCWKDGGTWAEVGYRVEQVTNPGGPFDGYWYLSDYKMTMNREVVISPYYLPEGSGGKEINVCGFYYNKNKAAGYDIDGFLAAIRKHEQMHGTLMKSALNANDPAPELEHMFDKDQPKLKDDADAKIRKASKTICEISMAPDDISQGDLWRGNLLSPHMDTCIYEKHEENVGGYVQNPASVCT